MIALEKNGAVSPFLALVAYPLGVLTYVVACAGQTVGTKILSGWDIPVKSGNSLPLTKIPLNIKINSLEATPGSGSVYIRTAGNWAIILAKKQNLAKIVFKNGKVKFFNLNCLATVGRVSNTHKGGKKLRKAGDTKRIGRRPKVRGVAKNPVDHPHGGGKGKKSKNPHPSSPWGTPNKKKKKSVKAPF